MDVCNNWYGIKAQVWWFNQVYPIEQRRRQSINTRRQTPSHMLMFDIMRILPHIDNNLPNHEIAISHVRFSSVCLYYVCMIACMLLYTIYWSIHTDNIIVCNVSRLSYNLKRLNTKQFCRDDLGVNGAKLFELRGDSHEMLKNVPRIPSSTETTFIFKSTCFIQELLLENNKV